jgi:hypothetical protein
VLLLQSALDLTGQGPLVAALATAVAALVTVVVVLWRQNQALYREMANLLKEARQEAVQREERIHQTVDKVDGLVEALLDRRTTPPRL